MTKLTADELCEACGGFLVPPQLAMGFNGPKGADYLSLKCGRPYRWGGNPPRLLTVPASDPQPIPEDDAD